MVKSVSKILIIRFSSMGDVILLAPLIAELRSRYPAAEMVLITRAPYAHLFKDDHRITRVIGVDKGAFPDELATYGTFDIVIDLQNNRRSKRLLKTVPCSHLYRFDKMHTRRTILLLLRTNTYRDGVSIAQRYLMASGEKPPFGAPDFSIPFNGDPADRHLPFIKHGEIERPIIALFPFSAWKNKEWPLDYFISIGHFFLIKGWNVLIFGGEEDRAQAEAMEKKMGYRSVSLAGRLDLYECGSLLKKCNLALGCDSGLSHLARACGVKCGFIFGPTTHHFGFQPHNDPSCTIFEISRFCRPCHPHGGNFCMRLDHGCMRKIQPETVIKGLLELYHE